MNTRGTTTSAPTEEGFWRLSARQERVLAAWILVSLAGMAVWSGGVPWKPRGLVAIDQTERKPLEFRLDINQAPWQELTLLPRIGETLARRIVETREREGPFRRPEDLLRVRGIGPKTLDQFQPFLLDTFPTEGQ